MSLANYDNLTGLQNRRCSPSASKRQSRRGLHSGRWPPCSSTSTASSRSTTPRAPARRTALMAEVAEALNRCVRGGSDEGSGSRACGGDEFVVL